MSSKRVYESIAKIGPLYDFTSWLVGYKRAVDSFVKHIPFSSDQHIKVLDAGCGTGPYTLSILNRFHHAQVYAFDVNPGLIDRVTARFHKNARVHPFVADLNGDLKEVAERDFDLIITAGVLEYLPIEATVLKLAALLKEDGYFVNSPLKDNSLGRLVGYLYGCKPYPTQRNMSAFTNAGLALRERYVPGVLNFKEFHVFQKSAGAQLSPP